MIHVKKLNLNEQVENKVFLGFIYDINPSNDWFIDGEFARIPESRVNEIIETILNSGGMYKNKKIKKIIKINDVEELYDIADQGEEVERRRESNPGFRPDDPFREYMKKNKK